MTITSSVFAEGDFIPKNYTCDGDNVSPPITNSDVPENTRSLVLIMEDPDATSGVFTHWILYNMSPTTLQLIQNVQPEIGMIGVNDFGTMSYSGPCPPQDSGLHHYYFRLYALYKMLSLQEGAKRHVLDSAMEGHIIDTAYLMGTYQKD